MNTYAKQKSKRISILLRDNFRKIQKRNNSVIIKRNSNISNSKFHKTKNKNNAFVHKSLLYEVKKISPIINLEYQIELYEKKGKYSIFQKGEIINEKRYAGKNFLKKDFIFKDSFAYKPTLVSRNKNRFYNSNKKSISHGKFRSMLTDKNTSFIREINISKNINNKSISQNTIKEHSKNKQKSSTIQSTMLSSTMRPISAKSLSITKIKNDKKKYLYLKNKCKKIRHRINETIEKVNNISEDLNNDILDSKNYDKLSRLEEKNKSKINKDKTTRRQKYINNTQRKILNKYNSDLYKNLDFEKNVENKMINSYKYYDTNGKKIMKEIMAQDKKIEEFLHKNQETKDFILNNNNYIKKLNKEFSILGADILSTKKKYKGRNAIEPEKDASFFHKLIKEKMLNNLNDDDYIKEVVKRKIKYL